MLDTHIEAVGQAAQAHLHAATTATPDKPWNPEVTRTLREYILARARLDVAQIEAMRAMKEDGGDGQ